MAETLGRRGWAGKVLVSLGMKALRQGLLKESVAVLSRLPLPGLPSGTDPTGTGD